MPCKGRLREVVAEVHDRTGQPLNQVLESVQGGPSRSLHACMQMMAMKQQVLCCIKAWVCRFKIKSHKEGSLSC